MFRRGFTLNGQPIGEAATDEKLAIIKVKEESSAYFFWAIYLTLVILAIGNLMTTAIIINVLRYKKNFNLLVDANNILQTGASFLLSLFGQAHIFYIHENLKVLFFATPFIDFALH